ncbi:unnamed protein product [Adineta steineri]|uniref:F-box domain-containing protein n=1 Tax=Adineta steineri TaxID=433720 RepID=A0A815Z8Q2_9BILA|nr:unnamed protein product [Adineta steineri]CAF1580821.1 unnamed protein product [Adineta steineri]
MIDSSIELPDLCWFNICRCLSIAEIAQLSSTCQTLRHMLWSHESSLWFYLIHLKCKSTVLCQSIRVLIDQDENEDEDVIIAENNRFSQRLLLDMKTYEVFYEKFLKPRQFRSWYSYFTTAENEIRGFFAYRRFMFPNPIRLLDCVPMLDCPVLLSSKLFRLYFYRLNNKSILAPIGALIYCYLINHCRCLSVDDMVYEERTRPIHVRRPVKIDNDGGISIAGSYESSISLRTTYFYFNQIPLWADLLPGRYNLTCQMRLRRQFVDQTPNDNYLLSGPPIDICLLGDRADRGGRLKMLRYNWLTEQHQIHGDDRWFNVTLIENFLLNDISNVYFGIRVKNNCLIFFNIWINDIQLNLIAIN